MRAKDLMVGDLVNIYVFPNNAPQEKDLFPAKICSIITETYSEDDATVECTFAGKDGKEVFASRPSDTCFPIPLTKEILSKSGFEKFGPAPQGLQLWVAHKSGRRFKVYEWAMSGKFGTEKFNIQFVHELQHLLNLEHIDLKIRL